MGCSTSERWGTFRRMARTLNNIKRHSLKAGKTIAVVINNISDKHVLHCEHLGDSNRGFVADSLRGAGSEGIKLVASAKKGNATPEQYARVRDANRETLVKHSVRSHEGFCYDGDDGEPNLSDPVPNTADGIAAVVAALPNDIFDMVLDKVLNPENYRDTPIALPADEVAKK
jgi:hypothetical protein